MYRTLFCWDYATYIIVVGSRKDIWLFVSLYGYTGLELYIGHTDTYVDMQVDGHELGSIYTVQFICR